MSIYGATLIAIAVVLAPVLRDLIAFGFIVWFLHRPDTKSLSEVEPVLRALRQPPAWMPWRQPGEPPDR